VDVYYITTFTPFFYFFPRRPHVIFHVVCRLIVLIGIWISRGSHLTRQSNFGTSDAASASLRYPRILTQSQEWISIGMERASLGERARKHRFVVVLLALLSLGPSPLSGCLFFALDSHYRRSLDLKICTHVSIVSWYSGSYDGLIRIWDTATGECLKTVYAEGNPPVGSVHFSPNGRFVLSGTLDGKLRLYDLTAGHGSECRGVRNSGGDRPQPRGGKCAKTYAGHRNSKYCIFAAFLSSNPRRQCVVSGSEDGNVYLYDLQSRLSRQTLEGHTDAVLAVDAHDSVELIGSGGMGNDRCVRFWAP
jgi:WD40 repeat protein